MPDNGDEIGVLLLLCSIKFTNKSFVVVIEFVEILWLVGDCWQLFWLKLKKIYNKIKFSVSYKYNDVYLATVREKKKQWPRT